jgi:hypothetical protein
MTKAEANLAAMHHWLMTDGNPSSHARRSDMLIEFGAD